MDLLELEQQREALENSLQKLKQTLKHWQQWEAEYEGLKEEILSGGDELTASQLSDIAKSYDGELVNEKEALDLAGLDKGSPRTAKQIVGLIERRQEYVQKNIESVQKQYFDAEAKSEELAFAARESPGPSAGLPLTEIHEELDEEGNVISSHLSRPEEDTSNIVKSLRKAGLNDDDLERTSEDRAMSEALKPAITNTSPMTTPSAITNEKRGHSDSALESPNTSNALDLERPSIRKKSVSFSADTKAPPEQPRHESEDGRKSVSFADKVAVMPAAPLPDSRSVSFSAQVEEIPPQPLEATRPDVQTDQESEAQGHIGSSNSSMQQIGRGGNMDEIVIPDDESPEDAQTRREMLEYHLSEVGRVVAQMDIEEGALNMDLDDDDDISYHTTSEYLEDEDTPYCRRYD